MSASSDSNDASELFWPGYVDAVTNLAINLLFVIAVMSIVVLSSILQISKMKPDYTIKDSDAVLSKPIYDSKDDKEINKSSENSNGKNQDNKLKELNKAVDQYELENKLVQQSEKIIKLENEISKLRSEQLLNKSAKGKKQQPGGTDIQPDQADIVSANEKRISNNVGENQLLPLSAGGLLVIFDKDVINLSENEESELIGKLNNNSQLLNTNWLIKVNVPKGFSESSRIGYYRVNSVRNILIKNKVDPAKITLRVSETESGSANNSRILIK